VVRKLAIVFNLGFPDNHVIINVTNAIEERPQKGG